VRDDLRSALDWVIETQQTEAALQIGSYLSWFWFRRSDLGEGRRWLEKVVNLPDASQYPHWYSNVLTELARGTWRHVGAGQAKPFVEKAISVAQQHDDQWNVAQASLILRLVLIDEGDFTGAQEITAKSKTFFRNVQDERGYAHAVHGHGLIAFLQDDITLALALHEESLAIFRRLGDKFFQNVALRFIGIVQVRQGNLQHGREALREALLLAREIDSKYEIAAAINHIGDAALAADDHIRAVHLKWASRNIYDSIGAWQQQNASIFENELALCRTRLNETEFAAAIAEGRAMTMEQAIDYALSINL
jgi:non-specific serine/threonine protein kinase